MFKNKLVGVFGLGISGLSTLNYLKRNNCDFIAFDDNMASISNIKEKHPHLSDHLINIENKLWQSVDYLVLSPGIPLSFPQPHKIIQICSKAEIISDIEILYLSNPDAFYIGVTGTNGKSTTTALIGHILKSNNIDVSVCGNIGFPVLDIVSESNKKVYVIEASSFQIDLLNKTKFNIAILLNITPDHLDRHGSMDLYIKTKYQIFKNQEDIDISIINYGLDHDSIKTTFSTNYREADLYIENNRIFYDNQIFELLPNNSLIGNHNAENIAAAFLCCIKYGLSSEQIVSAIASFVGLKHRMQYLGEYSGIVFINDSKATNADSSEKALKSFDNIIWIVGGIEKEGGITELEYLFPKVKLALLIGKSSENFMKTLEGKCNYVLCNNLENAFKIALENANKNDVVLLSPACASYDQWKNFEQRGDAFIQMFEELNE